MTPTPTLDHLVLRSPDALVAAVPYLLGFHPRESAVAVWLRGRRIVLTQRLDLPSSAAHHPAWLAAMWNHPMSESADEMVLAIVSEHPADPDLVALVSDRAAEAGMEMRDVLRIHEGRWWSLLCSDEQCCPREGRAVDPDTAGAVAAEFTVAGRAPLATRQSLEDALGPDQVRQALVAVALAAAPAPPSGAAREPWRDDRIRSTLLLLAEDPGTGEQRAERIADVLRGIDDVRVRDTVLWEVSRWEPEALESALDRLSDAVRSAPVGYVAPVATCAAIVAWLLGDGARARIAVDRACRDDAGYSLAVLVAASLAAGLPPAAWRESMTVLTRDDCRHGAEQRGSAARGSAAS